MENSIETFPQACFYHRHHHNNSPALTISLAEIIHLPEEVSSGSKAALYISRDRHSRSNSRLYNSTDDDEERVVYRGHPARRPVPEVGWQFRRRDSSDLSSQPLSAPSGLEAQKADNFRRFYRAVVSPTHVRVTAGGRIVPNTRAPPQPMFSWNEQTHVFGTTTKPLRCKTGDEFDQQAPWLQGVRLDMTEPIVHLRDSYAAIPRATLFSPAIQAVTLKTEQGIGASQKNIVDDHRASNSAATTASEQDEHPSSPAEEITISPPYQFDTSKPFLYNGQWVYPMPPGFQPPVLPFNLLGNVNPMQPQFISQGQAGMYFPQQLQFSTPNVASSFPMLSTTQRLLNLPGFAPVMLPSGSPQTFQSPCRPFPAGPLPGSPTTEQQVQALQQHIKHLENQLENNKHQIDEAHVIAQREMARSQIAALLFQSTINEQAHHLQGTKAQVPRPSNGSTGAESLVGLGLHSTQQEINSPGAAYIVSRKLGSICEPNAEPNQSTAITQPLGQLTSRSFTGPIANEASAPPKPEIRKRLSAAAAMAPPFLPRNLKASSDISGDSFPAKDPTTVHPKSPAGVKGSQKNTDTQHALASTTKASDRKLPFPHQSIDKEVLSMPKPQTMRNIVRTDPFDLIPAALQSFNAHPFATGTGPTDPSMSHGLGDPVPYLYGFPPSGMTFEKASSSELQYSRKLTEDEQRARHLYWGKAPREALKGLPKFDGRDFYPPSPVKKPAAKSFESEFASSTKLYPQGTQDWQPTPNYRERIAVLRPSSLNEAAKEYGATTSRPPAPVLRHKYSWEKLLEKGDDDTASVNSWGVPKSVEEESFTRPTSRPTSLRGKKSSPRRYEIPNTHPALSR